jgi:hypothetical protein
VTELAFVELSNRVVESFQEFETLTGNARLDDTAVVGLAGADDEAALFHAVEEARHVWIMRNHAIADAAAREASGFGATENAQDIVLRAGEAF